MDSRVGSLSGLHVLVVENNRDAREILTMVLTYFGALVTSAKTAAGGLDSLQRIGPDVVICDLELPDHNGTWLVRESRAQGATAPFVAVSGLDFDERRLEEHGFAAYLRKPVDHEVLVNTVLAVVRRAA